MNFNRLIKPFLLGFTFSFLAIAFSSCDDENYLGSNIQPSSDQLGVNFIDTITVKTITVKEDSIDTENWSPNLLGFIEDPIFGTTEASFCSQFTISFANPTSFDSAKIDSIVLNLAKDGYYGKNNSSYNIHVYKLSEDLSPSSSYFSNTIISDNGVDLANVTVTPNLDSTNINLRVKLDNSLGQELLNAYKTGDLESDSKFKSFFKGLKIKAEKTSGDGNIMYYKMSSSALTIYYKVDTNKFSYSFNSDATCIRANHFSHSFSSIITDHINNSHLGQLENCYIQPNAGVKTKISFPGINELKKTGKYIINKAQLAVNVEDINQYTDIYPASNVLTLYKINSDGSSATIIDTATYDKTSKQYLFLLTKHFQQILNDEIIDYGLYIGVYNHATLANRVVIKGGSNPSGRMKLNISYTKLN